MLLIDGLNLIRRIYAAVPGEQATKAHDDGVLDSCERSLNRAINQCSPTHAAIVFEAGSNTWRHRLHPPYKAGRKPMPDGLKALLPGIEAAFKTRGVGGLRVSEYEADDVVASVALRLVAHLDVVIVSSDKGFLPLLNHGVRVRNHFEELDLTEDYVQTRFGVSSRLLPDYLALLGERAQGIPGVRGIGAKMAAKLVQTYGGLAAILAAAPDIPGRAGKALSEGEADAKLSLRLVSLRTDVEMGLKLSDFRLPDAVP
jgi:5'-3' exonuclease